VELQQVEVDVLGDPPHLVRRLVDEDADDLRPDGELIHDRLGFLGLDAAVRGAEVEAD